MLRTTEMLTITASSFTLDARFTGALALPWTKVGQQRGAQEVVTIDEPWCGMLLTMAAAQVPPGAPLLKGSFAGFRTFFAKTLATLKLTHCSFKPYSLRRGGATHDFVTHASVQRTLMRGRWSDMRTGRIYITDGAAAMSAINLPAAAVRMLAMYKATFLSHFHL